MKRKSYRWFVCLLTIALLILGLTNDVNAENQENIELEIGERFFTYKIFFDYIVDPYASAQFDIAINNTMELMVTDITFEEAIIEQASGTVDTVHNSTDGIVQVGFFSTQNQFNGGDSSVCTLTFSYTGNASQNVTIGGLKVWRFTGNMLNGIPELEVENIMWDKKVSVSRNMLIPTVAMPMAEPGSGTYSTSMNVQLSSSVTDSSIYYTTDGSEPTRGSNLYVNPLVISQTTTIKTFAVKEGSNDSPVATYIYTISNSNPSSGSSGTEVVNRPIANPGPGAYNDTQYVALSSTTSGAKIYYTTDGSIPTKSSVLYVVPIRVSEPTIIKAVAVKEGANNSQVASFAYEFSIEDQVIPEGLGEPNNAYFIDIGPEYNWAVEAINALANRGIVKGDGNGYFKPKSSITRGDYVVMLTRLWPLDMPSSPKYFKDVPFDAYYYDAILRATGAEWIKGIGDDQFNPKGSITRQDAFVIAYRMLNKFGNTNEEGDFSLFKDASKVASYAQPAMQFFVGKGIVKGSNQLLNPLGEITRAEAAAILYRIMMMYSL